MERKRRKLRCRWYRGERRLHCFHCCGRRRVRRNSAEPATSAIQTAIERFRATIWRMWVQPARKTCTTAARVVCPAAVVAPETAVLRYRRRWRGAWDTDRGERGAPGSGARCLLVLGGSIADARLLGLLPMSR